MQDLADYHPGRDNDVVGVVGQLFEQEHFDSTPGWFGTEEASGEDFGVVGD